MIRSIRSWFAVSAHRLVTECRMTAIAHIATDSIIIATPENAQLAEITGAFVDATTDQAILNKGAVRAALAEAGYEITGRFTDIDYQLWAVEITQS